MEFDDITGGGNSREQQLLMKTLEQENELQELRRLVQKIPKRPNTAPQQRSAIEAHQPDATLLPPSRCGCVYCRCH